MQCFCFSKGIECTLVWVMEQLQTTIKAVEPSKHSTLWMISPIGQIFSIPGLYHDSNTQKNKMEQMRTQFSTNDKMQLSPCSSLFFLWWCWGMYCRSSSVWPFSCFSCMKRQMPVIMFFFSFFSATAGWNSNFDTFKAPLNFTTVCSIGK